MEYDGATTTCAPALEHEVFHSWFGRGVKPACASDGWIDEAMASWATASRQALTGRFQAEALGLDEEPSVLSPVHPWSRRTPREAYTAGSRLLLGRGSYGRGSSTAPVRASRLVRHLWRRCGEHARPRPAPRRVVRAGLKSLVGPLCLRGGTGPRALGGQTAAVCTGGACSYTGEAV